MTKQIPLSQGLFTTVDDEDYEFLVQWKWHASKGADTFYAIRNDGKRPFRKTIKMHRAIMNTPKGMDVDHADGNGLNNTRANLRNCTRLQNLQNRKIPSHNTSGYKGVYWHKGKWNVQIRINGKETHVGCFSNIEDAARAYDKAATKHHGEFANTNFTQGDK